MKIFGMVPSMRYGRYVAELIDLCAREPRMRCGPSRRRESMVAFICRRPDWHFFN